MLDLPDLLIQEGNDLVAGNSAFHHLFQGQSQTFSRPDFRQSFDELRVQGTDDFIAGDLVPHQIFKSKSEQSGAAPIPVSHWTGGDRFHSTVVREPLDMLCED